MANKFEFHVFVCQNQRPEGHQRGCCLSKGSDKIQNYMKTRVKELGIENVRVNKASCLDQCKKGPAMVIYPQGVWYTIKSCEEAEEVIQSHLLGKKVVMSLIMED
jgi:(2Fe-2S) ferredoxin